MSFPEAFLQISKHGYPRPERRSARSLRRSPDSSENHGEAQERQPYRPIPKYYVYSHEHHRAAENIVDWRVRRAEEIQIR